MGQFSSKTNEQGKKRYIKGKKLIEKEGSSRAKQINTEKNGADLGQNK